ncbi:acetyl esterase [Sporosarcina ureilytica]|uniref:Acetylesterase n=1 Tax=Sporosarcina ureilytica TaxID=298596 RepID=A0A1D8JCF8_9BACL|nr:acetyl esterase [Sporosarcina ureilytica]AOV06391.1 acetylesterase [Sporosarcina ureilytica]
MNKLNVYEMMTPEMVETLNIQNKLVGDAFSTDVTYEKMRENYMNERKYWNEGGPEPKRTVNLHIEGPHGVIPIRMHYPEKRIGKGVIIYIHGGGFTVGNLDTHSKIMRLLMAETGAVVVGIDYRLAPEYKYPTQVEECVFLVEWLRSHAEKYGINQDDIALAGDSAGANLCLATALYIRDRQKDTSFIRSLLLYYGTYGLTDSMSMRLLGGDYDGLSREDLNAYIKMYIGEEKQDLRYFDCFSNDLTEGLPPCYIAYGDLDPLQDDSKLLYDILNTHGQKAVLEEFKGVIHSFLHHSSIVPEAKEAIQSGASFYKSLETTNE